MPPKKPNPPATPNLPALPSNTDPDFLAALRGAGFVSEATEYHRVVAKGNTLKIGDKILGEYSQMKKEPALIVQLIGEPRQKQSLFFDKKENAGDPQSNGALAQALGRDGTVHGVPSIETRFCTSWYDIESQNKRFAEDGTSCDTCPVHPWVPKDQLPPEAKGRKCAWKAQVQFRILTPQADGTFAPEDDTIYSMDLSTTSVIEFFGSRGRRNDPMAGSVSELHTMAAVGALGFQKWGPEGVQKARTMLDLGGVICGIHLPEKTSDDGHMTWNVVSFRPIEIIEQEERAALPGGDDNHAVDEVPF